MTSRAKLAGHPIHPMLIPFPVGLLTTAVVFDVIYLDGWSLIAASLEERKKVLQGLLSGGSAPLRYSEHVVGRGEEFFRQACGLKLEGIVSKKRDASCRRPASTR